MSETRTQTKWNEKIKIKKCTHGHISPMNISCIFHWKSKVQYQCLFYTACCYWFPIPVQKEAWKKLYEISFIVAGLKWQVLKLHIFIKQATWCALVMASFSDEALQIIYFESVVWSTYQTAKVIWFKFPHNGFEAFNGTPLGAGLCETMVKKIIQIWIMWVYWDHHPVENHSVMFYKLISGEACVDVLTWLIRCFVCTVKQHNNNKKKNMK